LTLTLRLQRLGLNISSPGYSKSANTWHWHAPRPGSIPSFASLPFLTLGPSGSLKSVGLFWMTCESRPNPFSRQVRFIRTTVITSAHYFASRVLANCTFAHSCLATRGLESVHYRESSYLLRYESEECWPSQVGCTREHRSSALSSHFSRNILEK
jgi:hypothetical protein